ncbi:MAG: hypothetical protein ACLP36_13630 [Acidimicrobiales bacterium]
MSSTRPRIEIDPNSSVPLHEQVAAAVRRVIAEGEAGPGERPPPARELVALARHFGYHADELVRIIEQVS